MTSRIAELLRTPITFRAADGRTLHSPLVAATVAGAETLFVLDTGSEVQLMTTETAERAGLTLVEGEEGMDHGGTALASWSAGDVEVRLAGAELPLRDVVVIDPPPPFPGWGIGGILSPQHLHPRAATVIDLLRDELTIVEAHSSDIAAWLEARWPASTAISLQRDGRTTTPVVTAAVEPFAPAATMLNTGGRRTEFDETVVPGLAAGDPERLGGGVSGADVLGIPAGDQVLAVAGARIPVPDLAVRRDMGYPPGLVGMNVLRGTVLALDADPAGLVLWQLDGAT